MPGTINNEYGKVTISEDIIATVAGYAATENYGVVGMSAKTATDAILKLVGSEANKKRGVKVSFLGEGDEVDIDLYVTMVYGVSLPVVAKNIGFDFQGISHGKLPSRSAYLALVAHLATAFGIKRRVAEHYHALLPCLQLLHRFTRCIERQHRRVFA